MFITCDVYDGLRLRGFGNRLKYNLSDYPGIVIIPLPSRPNFTFWQETIETLIQGLNATEVIGKLGLINSQNPSHIFYFSQVLASSHKLRYNF